MKNQKTKIHIPDYEGQEYTLEFTPDSLKKMENTGFKFGKMDDIALTAVEELFYGAFIANHQYTPKRIRKNIYDNLVAEADDGEKLGEVLSGMLTEAIEELNSHSGNVKWSVLN